MARGDGEKFVAIADKVGAVGEGNLLWHAVDGGGVAKGNFLVFITYPCHGSGLDTVFGLRLLVMV